MSNVVPLDPCEVGDGFVIEPDDLLNAALGTLREVAILGTTKDGDLYIASSHGRSEVFFLIDLIKHHMLTEALTDE